jgi:bidirectional [NiFe] hydrogenase diaphorase subunit
VVDVSKAKAPDKYVICNADEGDPGAFMDRSVLESDPHRVLEGMAIAAYAVGASQGYIYVRAEYPLAVKRSGWPSSRRKARPAGRDICGTNFSFNIDHPAGGGRVCVRRGNRPHRSPSRAPRAAASAPAVPGGGGALGHAHADQQRGDVRQRGAHPAQRRRVVRLHRHAEEQGHEGLRAGRPHRQHRAHRGADGHHAAGYHLRHRRRHPRGRRFKAVQTGGPSGGCIPEQFLDMPVDYESLAKVGSIMGSGGMIVMDETSCMVDVAKFFMEFCMSESCGKCIPCRVGTAQMYDLLCRISDGRGTHANLELLEDLCDMVKHTSLCGLGQTAPNPVLSTLKFFRDEYMAHIDHKRCPAGVCKMAAPSEVHA